MKATAETPIEPGSRIGNYILKKEIGEGAFSHVWKTVDHERPNRVVAVKIATDNIRVVARRNSSCRTFGLDHVAPSC